MLGKTNKALSEDQFIQEIASSVRTLIKQGRSEPGLKELKKANQDAVAGHLDQLAQYSKQIQLLAMLHRTLVNGINNVYMGPTGVKLDEVKDKAALVQALQEVLEKYGNIPKMEQPARNALAPADPLKGEIVTGFNAVIELRGRVVKSSQEMAQDSKAALKAQTTERRDEQRILEQQVGRSETVTNEKGLK